MDDRLIKKSFDYQFKLMMFSFYIILVLSICLHITGYNPGLYYGVARVQYTLSFFSSLFLGAILGLVFSIVYPVYMKRKENEEK